MDNNHPPHYINEGAITSFVLELALTIEGMALYISLQLVTDHRLHSFQKLLQFLCSEWRRRRLSLYPVAIMWLPGAP